jgi:hypothetical protein
MAMFRLRPLHDALREAVGEAAVQTLAEIAGELTPTSPPRKESAASAAPAAAPPASPDKARIHPRLRALADKSRHFFERTLENLPHQDLSTQSATASAGPETAAKSKSLPAALPQHPTPSGPFYTEAVRTMLAATTRLPLLAQSYSNPWAAESRPVLPGTDAASRRQHVWAPILAWIVLRNLPWQRAPHGDLAELFDRLLLRHALADIFLSMGMEGESRWQAAAQVRLLLTKPAATPDAIRSESFWADPDVRWLVGVNQSAGVHYFNKERFEELLSWLQLPTLIDLARTASGDPPAAPLQPAQLRSLAKVEAAVAAARTAAEASGYNLDAYLAETPPTPPAPAPPAEPQKTR